MTSTMPPFDQSRQYLYDLPGEKRSSSYERWLNLRGDNGGDGEQGNGQNVGERDGNGNDENDDNDDNGDNGGKKNGGNDNGGGKGKKNGDNNSSNPPAAAAITPTPVVVNTAPLEATTTLSSTTSDSTTTAVAELQPAFQGALQPAIQPAIATDSIPVITLSPETTAEPLTLPTTALPFSIPATTEAPTEPSTTVLPQEPTTSTTMQSLPEPTTSTTPIFVPVTSASSTTSVASITEPPQQLTIASVYTSSPAITTSVVTMTMSASAVVTSITATTTEILVLTTSGAERKGEKDHNHHGNATTTTPSLADTNGLPPGMAVQKDPPLSPTAEHVLLAAGIIGAFILSGFLLYLFVRLRKIPVGEKFGDFLDRHPRLERIFSVIPAFRKRSQWARRSSAPGWDKGSSGSYESNVPTQKSMEAFYAPGGGYDEKSKHLSRSDSERMDADVSEKASIKYGMTSNPNAPLHVTNPSATMSFYNVQQPTNAYIPNAARMSELSSLSSGFGDAQIDVPESGPTNGTLNTNMNGYGSTMNTMNSNAATANTLQPYRQSFMQRASRAFAEPLTSRFSWTTANQSDAPANGQRDTIYTTTSEDSAPRFRTIHSWVNQQTHRVERGRTEPVPSMPPLPPSQRLLKRGSEEPAFRQHPGEEINIPEATRIESAILDRKLGNTAGL